MTDTQKPEPEKKPIWTRWWMIVIYVIVVIVGLGIIGSLGEDDTDGEPIAGEGVTATEGSDTTEPEETTTTAEATTTTTTEALTTTLPTAFLNMTVAEAPDRWNQAAGLLESDRRITGIMPERDLADGGKAHEWEFTDTATLEVVAFGENVQSVTLLTGASSDEAENINVLFDIATWIVMVDPTLVETSRGEILTALLENLDQGELDNEVVRNGVRYSAFSIAPLLVFTAEPA